MTFCEVVSLELRPVARDPVPDLVIVAEVELLEVPLNVLLAAKGVLPIKPSGLELLAEVVDDALLETVGLCVLFSDDEEEEEEAAELPTELLLALEEVAVLALISSAAVLITVEMVAVLENVASPDIEDVVVESAVVLPSIATAAATVTLKTCSCEAPVPAACRFNISP